MRSIREILRGGAKIFAARHSVAKGVVNGGERPLSVLWSGADSHFAYFCTRVFASSDPSNRRVRRRSIFTLSNSLDRYDCDIAAVVLGRRFAEAIKQPGDLIIPVWVRCDIELGNKRAYTKSGSIRSDLRNIRKSGFEWRISADPGVFEHFHEKFYLPTVSAAHGTSAIPASKRQRLELLESGDMELLQVFRNDEFVGGVSIDYRGKVPELRDSGVLDGSPELKKAGAVTATYIYAMDHLASSDYPKVGFGLSRGFLDDGVLAYKRKFRPTILPGPDECILVRTRNLNEVTRAVLCSCPCLTWENGELHRTYFKDGHSDASEKCLRKQRNGWSFGIKQEKVFDVSSKALQILNAQEAA
jgi:hypothetical protein